MTGDPSAIMTTLERTVALPPGYRRDGLIGDDGQPSSFSTAVLSGGTWFDKGAEWDDRGVSHQSSGAEGGGVLAGLGDAQLVVAVARADERALAELYRRHGRLVYGLARRLLADGSEAEDVTQEVFVHLWEHPERFDPDRGSLRTYLLARTHSRSVDVVRSRASRLRREEREARSAQVVTSDLEREVWDLAVADRLSRALSALPATERSAIELAYFGGYSYREVANMLSEPEGTVKSRIRKGLQRLRTVMNKVEGHDDRGS
jgi:RNA polymerase sigma-70 factor (ECF subfamily)